MSAYDLHDTLDIAYPWDDDTMLEHDQQDIVDLYELPWEVDSTPEHIDHTRRVHKVDKQQDIAEWIEKWVTEHIYSRSKEDDWYLMDDLWYEPAIPARRVHPMQPARRHRE